MVAEDATITEEVQPAVLAVQEAQLQEEKAILRREKKAGSEATGHLLQGKAVSAEEALHQGVKAVFHLIVPLEGLMRHGLKVRQKGLRDVRKASGMRPSQSVREKAKTF